MWMNPPNVYDVTTPSSHNTHSTASRVQSIAIPISQENPTSGACDAPGGDFVIFQMVHHK
jgi:hypothetical protein